MKGLWLRIMKLIDSNVILRYLLRDIEEQYETAVSVIARGTFTTPEVLAEVVYVLKGVYNTERSDIADNLVTVLDHVTIENKDAMLETINIYRSTSLDFVDCILIGRNHILGDEVISFDKKLNKRLR